MQSQQRFHTRCMSLESHLLVLADFGSTEAWRRPLHSGQLAKAYAVLLEAVVKLVDL